MKLLSHHSMSAVGGFFGVYALFMRSDVYGSAATANLIYLFAAGLKGSLSDAAVRIGALGLFALGISAATVLLRRGRGGYLHRTALGIDLLCCLVLAQIPAGVNPVLALYPMFFASAFQWVAYSQAGEFNSSTIFNSNNVRQCVTGLTAWLCDRDPVEWRRFVVFGGGLLCFHLGVIYAWFCMQIWGLKSIYACIPLLLWTVLAERLGSSEGK